MSLRQWVLRALSAEVRAQHAERRADLAEHLAVTAMRRLSDDDLLAVRAEVQEGKVHDDDTSV